MADRRGIDWRVKLRCSMLLIASVVGCGPAPKSDKPDASPKTGTSTLGTSSSESSPVVVQSPPVSLPSAATPKVAGMSYDDKVDRANRLLEANDGEGAWKLAKDLLIERPKHPTSLFVAARCMAWKGDLKGAIGFLSRVDENDPDAGPPATGQLAEWMAASGDLVRAEPKLKLLITKFPNSPKPFRLLIDIYSAQGRRWESAPLFDQLVRLGNFNEEEMMRTLDFRIPYEHEQLRKAAIAFAPEEPYSKLCELRFKESIDRWQDALEPLRAIVAERPELLEPWVWYGEALWQLGRVELIPQWQSKRPDGFADHPEYWYVLGSLLSDQGKGREAARCHYQAIQLDRRHLAAHQALANCLLELGLNEPAQRVRQRVRALVRIFDLAEQIRRSYGGNEARKEIAALYHELDDPIGAFAWDALLVASERRPMTEALVATQKGLRSGSIRPGPVLPDLVVKDWPLPADTVYESTTNSNIAADGSDRSIRMEDIAHEMGVDVSYDNGAKADRGWYTLEGLGGGVSVLDYDRDGWPDLFFSQAGDSPTAPIPQYKPKKLFRSMQGTHYDEITMAACVPDLGYGQGTCAADIDQDGYPDLLIANVGSIVYYRNQGDGTFEVVPLPQAPDSSRWNSSIQAADLDGDGLPEIIQGIYIDGLEVFQAWCQSGTVRRGSCHPKSFPPGMTRILFNQGDGGWKLADRTLLDSLRDGYVLGILVTNLDQQAGNDVFIANDVSPNHWLQSERVPEGGFRWVERAAAAGVAVDAAGRAQACMGIACGDQNRDGLLDLIVTNYRSEVSTLYLQTSPGVFFDGTRRAQLGPPTLEWLSFGCQLVDLDNDGWLDFATLNGYIDSIPPEGIPWKMPQQILRNVHGKFEWLRNPSPGSYFEVDAVGRGLSMLDYNRDGLPDLVATHLDRPAALLENRSTHRNAFVQFELTGTQCERDAIGAILRITSGDQAWTAAVSTGDGFYGTNERLVHLGLGSASRIDRLEIDWPDGTQERFEELPTRSRWHIIQGKGIVQIPLSH